LLLDEISHIVYVLNIKGPYHIWLFESDIIEERSISLLLVFDVCEKAFHYVGRVVLVHLLENMVFELAESVEDIFKVPLKIWNCQIALRKVHVYLFIKIL